jgi:hypothetical protein
MEFKPFRPVKPAPEITIKTTQQIFDASIRALVRQGAPCIRMYEAFSVDDVSPSELRREDLYYEVNMNVRGRFSPMFLLLPQEDIRYLRKTCDYNTLQNLTGSEVSYAMTALNVDSYCEQSRHHEPLSVAKRLFSRGISGRNSSVLIENLQGMHREWANYVIRHELLTDDLAEMENNKPYILANLNSNATRVGRLFNLDPKVLNF